jgi:hypothetical protein
MIPLSDYILASPAAEPVSENARGAVRTGLELPGRVPSEIQLLGAEIEFHGYTR